MSFNEDHQDLHTQERPKGFIDFATLNKHIGTSAAFTANIKYLDINRNAPLQGKGVEFVDAYINTNKIHLIETDSLNFYTLRIINNNPDDKANMFYHLVFEKNLVTGTVSSVILQYDPELSWLFDKSQGFKGDVKIFDNELISLEDITSNIDLNGELGRAITCAFAQQTWYCPNGHTSPDDLGGNCGGNYIITFTYLPCGVSGGNGGGTGGGNGGGGGSGSTQTAIFFICDDLALPGEGNSEDCEEQYADYFTPFICEEYVDGTLINSINNWASNPANNAAGTDLANYLINNFSENNCAEMNFEEEIFEIFEGSPSDCVHDNLKSSSNNTLYKRLLSHFSNATDNWLFFEVGNTGTDWGRTMGYEFNSTHNNLADAYRIIISNQIDQNGSNLAKMITLAHELIHAYMFDTLNDAGLITFDNTGAPTIGQTELNNLSCNNLPTTNSTNLNSYTTAERFSIMMCTLINNNLAHTTDWSHDLFGTNVFSVTTYQQQLANFIFEEHDWNSESSVLINFLQTQFGADWKMDTAKVMSWRGLENTQEFHNWYINSGYTTGTDINGNTTYPTMATVNTNVLNFGNSNCN